MLQSPPWMRPEQQRCKLEPTSWADAHANSASSIDRSNLMSSALVVTTFAFLSIGNISTPTGQSTGNLVAECLEFTLESTYLTAAAAASILGNNLGNKKKNNDNNKLNSTNKTPNQLATRRMAPSGNRRLRIILPGGKLPSR